jgi:hypothetical protein
MELVSLDVHGLGITCSSKTPSVAAHFRHDFHFFLAREGAQTCFTLVHSENTDEPLHWRRLLAIGRLTFYRAPRGYRRIAYYGRAWIEYSFGEGRARVYCAEPGLAYEVCQSAVLSYLGEALDRRGIHRVHGLGLSFSGDGALLLAASGTGKSFLTLDLLNAPGPSLLSDDVPFVRNGELLEFPHRIAIRERPEHMDEAHVRKFFKTRYGEKYVVSSSGFHSRIGSKATARWIGLMSRKSEGAPELRFVGRIHLVLPLLRWLVAGHETPQMWELFLRFSPRDLAAKVRITFSRLSAAVSLLRGSRAFVFRLSPDRQANVRALLRLPELETSGPDLGAQGAPA